MNHVYVAIVLLALASFSSAGEDAKPKDYTDVPLDLIGFTPFKPAKDAKTGFIVGGKNATELVRTLTELNGRTIADLEKDMRPGAVGGAPMGEGLERYEGSTLGFLGKEEKLLDVLAMDNAFVVDKLGLTHQDVARPLMIAASIGSKNRFAAEGTAFRYHGQDFRIKMICYKGFQYSPFFDRTSASCDAVLENLTAKKKLKFSLLVPQMIERYGFYEGQGTPYRVEPAEVVELFPFLKEKAKGEKKPAQASRPLLIEGADAGIVKATIAGPEFAASDLFTGVEDPTHPVVKRLRTEYRLDEVVKGETSEFGKILKLRHWVHSRWLIDNDQKFNGDVFAILEKAKAGEGFNCSHAMKVQHAVMTAMGFVVRDLGVQCNTEEYPKGFHHGVNEVWSNDLAKWVLLDGEYDFHFERDGQVLSALEAHEAARRDGGRGVVKVQGPDRRVVPMQGLGFPFTSVIGYWWTSYHVRQNTFTQPTGNESRLVIFDNDAYRQTTWFRMGSDQTLRKHWAYGAKAFIPTRDRHQIEWTPGVPALSVRGAAPGELDVRIRSVTPNLAAYEIRLNGALRDVEDGRVTWKLAKGDNTLVVRSRNVFGVLGPAVTATVLLDP